MNWLKVKRDRSPVEKKHVEYSSPQSIEGIILDKISNFNEYLFQPLLFFRSFYSLVIKTDLFTHILSDSFFCDALEPGTEVIVTYRLRTTSFLEYSDSKLVTENLLSKFKTDYFIDSIDCK